MRLAAYLVSILMLTPSFLLCGEEKPGVEQVEVVAIPNPLELQTDWWNYFNVPSDQLSAKIDAFEKYLDEFLSFYEKDHPEIMDEKEAIFQDLEFLRKSVSTTQEKEPVSVQVLQAYTVEQLLDLNHSIFQVQAEIAQIKDKISFENNRLTSFQSKLDKQVLSYYKLPAASFEKLVTGLQIIELRIEIAVHKLEVDGVAQTLAYDVKKKEELIAELKTAKGKVVYSSINKETLRKDLEDIQKNIDNSQARLKELEKKRIQQELSGDVNNQLENQLLYYKTIYETINVENFNILAVQDEIKIALYDVVENEMTIESEGIRNLLRQWTDALTIAKQKSVQWQGQLEDDHVQVNKMVQDSLQNSGEVSSSFKKTISDIHLEIDKSFVLIDNIQSNASGAELLMKLVESRFIQEKGFTESWMILAKNHWATLLDDLDDRTNFSLFYIKDRPVTVGVLLKAILTIIIAWLFSKFLRNVLFEHIFSRSHVSKSTRYLVLRFLHYIVILLACLIALSFLGIDLTSIAIVFGVLGVGIGFGLQGIASNAITGFTILFHRYLKVGDIVEVQGEMGTIVGMTLQFTHFRTLDGANQMIPNSSIFNHGLKNWTMYNPYRRYRVPFQVAYGTDKDKLRREVLPVIHKESYVLTGLTKYSDPDIWFIKYGDSALEFELVVWVNLDMKMPHGTAPSSLLWVLDNILKEMDVVIPFPRQDLYIKEFPR